MFTRAPLQNHLCSVQHAVYCTCTPVWVQRCCRVRGACAAFRVYCATNAVRQCSMLCLPVIRLMRARDVHLVHKRAVMVANRRSAMPCWPCVVCTHVCVVSRVMLCVPCAVCALGVSGCVARCIVLCCVACALCSVLSCVGVCTVRGLMRPLLSRLDSPSA